MSEVVTEPVKTEPTTEPAEELVSKKVLEEYKADFFKLKESKKALDAENQRLKDEKALREKDELIKNENWKQLWETEKSERLKFETELKNNRDQYVNTAKVNAVVQLLGGLKNSAYSTYIKTSNIDVGEDGVLNHDSVRREADRFRQEHPELLNAGPASGKMPSNAPNVLGHKPVNNEKKTVEQMYAEYTNLQTRK